jgi:2-phospho-L-lactate guanylyltransferase
MTAGADDRCTAWTVVIPLKPIHLAKSRMGGLPGPLREALVVAMALDVRDAVLGCRNVAEVIVVSRDPRWRPILARRSVRFVSDPPEDSLNHALRRGALEARRGGHQRGIAALTGDLPALTADELGAALRSAAGHASSFTADAGGTGTTLLAARGPSSFSPCYGPGSRLRHLRAGARELGFPRRSGLRQDVDTPDDLAEAVSIGVGPHTRAVLLGHRRAELDEETVRQ